MAAGDRAAGDERRPWMRVSRSAAGEAGVRQFAPGLKDFTGVWLTQGVPQHELNSLGAQCEDRHYTAGETVFRKGDASDGLYLLLSGTVRIVTHSDDGETLLASVGPGECFGEMGVIDGEPRSATAVAATLSSVRFVPTEPFLDMLERVPLVSMKLLALLSDRLRRTNSMVADLPGEINRAQDLIES
jgi:CRP/FNR family cyclic AMP-dependent transcriptional regulator